ncbi:MAG: N-acetyltransferase [Lentisphaeria bacterium]|nr:N-acetyltransferase [Lentisphaeria bacterium]
MKVKKLVDQNFILSKLNKRNNVFIHHTAEVSENATVGKDTRIWNNAQIRENCQVGRECVISKDVYIDIGVCIGNRCKIQNGVSVYRGVTLEDDVFLGPHMTFTNDLFPRAFVADFELHTTLVRKGCSVGAHATIVCGVELGEYSMIGAGSVVTRNVPPFSLFYGNPAKFHGYVGCNGEKLSFDDNGIALTADGKKYKLSEAGVVLYENE